MCFLFLTSCVINTAPNPYKPFKFNDKVKILSGFYEGQTGVIIMRIDLYQPGGNINGFRVKFDLDKEERDIDQLLLEKIIN